MTDDDDPEPTAGVPERIERAESGGHATDSGRLVTNRNVVQRTSETSGLRDLRRHAERAVSPDAFDVITPVRPQPRDIFEAEGATLSRDEMAAATPRVPLDLPLDLRLALPLEPAGAPAGSPSGAPATGQKRITPTYSSPLTRDPPPDTARAMRTTQPGTATAIQARTAGKPAPPTEPPQAGTVFTTDASEQDAGDRLAEQISERLGRAASDGFVPPESRRPGSDHKARITPLGALDQRRPDTVRGHVEPRRRPTTPPPNPAADPPEPEPGDPEPRRTGPAGGHDRLDHLVTPPRGVSAIAAPAERTPARPGDRSSRETPRLVIRAPSPPLGGAGSSPELSPYEPGPARSRPSARLASATGEPSPYDRSQRETPRPASASDSGAGEPSHHRARPRAASASDSTPGEWPVLPSRLDRGLRLATIGAVLGLGALGLARPASVLTGGVAWLGFLVFVLAGWGALVGRIARRRGSPGQLVRPPDIGLGAAVGAAGYLAIAGVAVAAGVLTRPVVVALIAIGAAGFAWRELTAPVASWHRVRDAVAFARTSPALTAAIAALVAIACVRLVGAVAALDANPWDDDLAYTPLVKRLLDTGDLVEPFSFRRLGAYGGQTALAALAAARGTLANLHLIDKGIGLAVALLVVIGHARARKTQPLWLALIMVVLVLLPDTAINTASYWTGVALFVALYRAVVREHWAVVGLVGAAVCTLRQNFLAVVVVFVGAVLVIRLVALARTMPVREAWHGERAAWRQTAGVAAAVMLPWWIAAYASSRTFLYPVIDGTWNHQLSLSPEVTGWPEQLASLATLCLEPQPFVVLPILALVIVFAADRRPGRPLTAFALAGALGFLALSTSIVGGEPHHLWRYAFGFATALIAILVIEVGADDEAGVAVPPLGRWLVLAALVVQLTVGRGGLPRQALALASDIREARALDARGDPGQRAERDRYALMQAALPAGARAIVMVDDPALLDYARNPIASIDTPGFASPGAQLPSFAGAEPLRAYLVAEGYRYAAFVRSERSRYFYRRPFWLWRLFNDGELFRIMSAYAIDAIDSFAELATTTRVLYDHDGLVVLDLGSPLREASRRTAVADEPTRRGRWIRELADQEGLHDAWSLTSRTDLRFEDGVGALRIVDGEIDDPAWYELARARARDPGRPGVSTTESRGDPGAEPPDVRRPGVSTTGSRGDPGAEPPDVRGTPILPLHRRAHLRVRTPPGAPATDMRLVLRAAIALRTVHTRPRLDVSLDGELLASVVADPAGRYQIDVVVPRSQLAGGWHDLYLVFSSIAEPSKDIRDLRIARLESVEWAPP